MASAWPDATANPKQGTRGYLKWWWTQGPGKTRWVGHAHPWTALYRQLVKHMSIVQAKRTASQWFKDVYGYWPGSRKGSNRLGPG